MNDSLKPCPFCGGKAEQPNPDQPHGGMVRCTSCGAEAFGPKWNRRITHYDTERHVPDGWQLVPKKLTAEMIEKLHMYTEIGSYICANWAGAYHCMDEYHEKMLSSAPSPPAAVQEPVVVKELEWEDGYWEFHAKTILGTYRVDQCAEKARFYALDRSSYQWFGTIEKAKAAAQADYEQRIRSALSTSQSDGGRVNG